MNCRCEHYEKRCDWNMNTSFVRIIIAVNLLKLYIKASLERVERAPLLVSVGRKVHGLWAPRRPRYHIFLP